MQEAELRAYQPQPVDASKIKHIHLIGIAGTGMGTLAGMLKQSGYTITGSDQGVYPPMSDQLAAWKIKVQQGFSPAHLQPRPDLVIVGNACRPSNPEVQAAIEEGIPCTSMPRAIHDIYLSQRDVAVVAGTHGKTTTTALTGWLLASAKRDPGVLVGGVCANFNGSYLLPKGSDFVIEGDEYDSALFDKVPKFIHYNPKRVILTSVEFDHADIYKDIDAVKVAFLQLMERIPEDGTLWVCRDYPLAMEVAQTTKAKVLTYSAETHADLFAKDIRMTEQGARFMLCNPEGDIASFEVPIFGRYNIANAIAAIGVALDIGLSHEEIQQGLSTFQGIRRRQEIYARIGDLILIDDFAHHPTAIRVTTQAIRERFHTRRIWGIFEPRSNTARRNVFQDDLPRSFDACDIALFGWPYLFDKMASEERLDIEKVIQDLKQRGKRAIAFPEVDQIVSYVTSKARPNDVVVIMSNGGFGGIHKKLQQALENRFHEGAWTEED
ncbi:MAG: UDP-N-acetylmuramate--L-alanine ligase [Myxococcales bacterium]|nr:UDP-N-acetylmuramate--L-alanine ligase [Myxococcales bacterium]